MAEFKFKVRINTSNVILSILLTLNILNIIIYCMINLKSNKIIWQVTGEVIPEILLTLSLPLLNFEPPENIRKPLVFSCFQGKQKGALER